MISSYFEYDLDLIILLVINRPRKKIANEKIARNIPKFFLVNILFLKKGISINLYDPRETKYIIIKAHNLLMMFNSKLNL